MEDDRAQRKTGPSPAPAWLEPIDADGCEAFDKYYQAVIAFSRKFVSEFGSPESALGEMDHIMAVCPVFSEGVAEMMDDLCLFLAADAGMETKRGERYDAFDTYGDAISSFALELVRSTGEPNDAMHEVEQTAIIFPTFAECTQPLFSALRFAIWTYGMTHEETQLCKDARTRSEDGTHRYDGTDPDIPF